MRVLTLSILFLPLGPLAGQASQAIDPAVTFVTTGGHWADAAIQGQYRVVVRTRGAGNELAIDWLRDSRSPGDTALVVAHVVVQEVTPWIYSLIATRITCDARTCRVQAAGVNPRDGSRTRWSLALERPGHYTMEPTPK